MGSNAPDFGGFLANCWNGSYYGTYGIAANAAASNIVIGSNPPYSAADFLAIYPQFGGLPVSITGDITAASVTVNNVSSVAGLAAGQLITGPISGPLTASPNTIASQDLYDPTTIAAVTSGAPNTITLSVAALNTVVGEPLTVYTAPFVPLALINLYINLASASLAQGRYLEAWPIAMALFLAHYCSLYLRSNGNPTTTAGQAAASGALLGFQTSKSVGDVSVSQQMILDGDEKWGSFSLSLYGQQLITMARIALGITASWVSGW